MKLNLPIRDVVSYIPKKELAKRFPISDFRSVTQVLSPPKKNEWLKAQLKDPTSAMAKATRQGTLTHQALETGESKDAFISACLDRFQQEILIDLDEVWGQEEWLAHPLGYKGKFDGVGVFRGKVTLFDHKKTNKRKSPKQLISWFQQLAAYHQAHSFLYPDHPIEQIAIFNIFGKTEDELGTRVTTLDGQEIMAQTTQFNTLIAGKTY